MGEFAPTQWAPKAYADTQAMALLRMAERFGQDPLGWCGRVTPGWFELLLAYELVRRSEEAGGAGASA